MQLAMTVLRCPDAVAPEARTVPGGEFTVGRGPGVDWVLPDAERQLSKRHFAVAYRAGAWQLADTSTNGTFLNREADAIGPGDLRTLRDGDRIRLGAYEIEIRLVEEAAQSAGGFGAGYGGGFGNAPAAGSSPFGDPFGMDPLAPPPAARRPFDEPAYQPGGMAPSAAQLPHDFDPLSPLGGDAQFQGPVQSDHSPVLEDAFRPPTAVGQAPLHSGGTIPGDDLLPDNWDEDLLAGIGDPPAPLAPPSAHPQARAAVPPSPQPPIQRMPVEPPTAPQMQPQAQPFAQPQVQPLGPAVTPAMGPAPSPVVQAPVVQAPAVQAPVVQPVTHEAYPAPAGASPFDEPSDAPGTHLDVASAQPAVAEVFPPQPVLVSPAGHPPVIEPAGGSPFAEPSDPPSAAPRVMPAAPPLVASRAPALTAAPAAAQASAGQGDALLAAFLDGAGMPDVTPADPSGTMRALGAAFRSLVGGLRAVLIARASIKSEFRIEQTMIRARGNNPLKFSAGDDDALSALLGSGRRTDMTPAAAVEDALKDIRLHELASMAAMQSAVRSMLEGLDPAKLRAAAEQGGMTVLPAQKKARAWDAYEALHAKTVQALSDDFDSIFGKAFARAYERALDEVSAKERR